MNRQPYSLAGRLRLAAIVAVVTALLLAGVAIALILHRFVVGQVDQRLDTQILAVASALHRDADGKLTVTSVLNGPPYDRPGSGWVWQVSSASGSVVSPSLGSAGPVTLPNLLPDRIENVLGLKDWAAIWRTWGRPKSAAGHDADGRDLHWRVLDLPFEQATVTVAAGAPYNAISGPLREALLPLALALIILGLLLLGALLAQVRLGLRPLNGMRAGLVDIRAGRASALPSDQPAEIKPLIDELNSLLTENAEGLARARRHVANLAHSLKTPLAALGLELERGARKSLLRASDMRVQLDLMERLIRHHLARARVAVLAGPARASTPVHERLADLAGMMGNIHRERGLQIGLDADKAIAVAIETQDFDEIFGNLIDNACKWARSRVEISVQSRGERVVIDIEDDGPGIDVTAMPAVLQPGHRIDEATPGHGFGLPIALELIELYGGSLDLSQASPNGLRATVVLPRTVP